MKSCMGELQTDKTVPDSSTVSSRLRSFNACTAARQAGMHRNAVTKYAVYWQVQRRSLTSRLTGAGQTQQTGAVLLLHCT